MEENLTNSIHTNLGDAYGGSTKNRKLKKSNVKIIECQKNRIKKNRIKKIRKKNSNV